jgi:hypothetical protein
MHGFILEITQNCFLTYLRITNLVQVKTHLTKNSFGVND